MKTMTPVPRFRVLIATVAFSAVASSLAALCAANDFDNPPTELVKYGDLNLASPQGASELYGRIHAAAQNVCAPWDRETIGSHLRYVACVRRAIAEAAMKVDKPALFAVYNAKNSTPLPAHLLSQSR